MHVDRQNFSTSDITSLESEKVGIHSATEFQVLRKKYKTTVKFLHDPFLDNFQKEIHPLSYNNRKFKRTSFRS